MTVGLLIGGPWDAATVDVPYVGKELHGPFFDTYSGKYVLDACDDDTGWLVYIWRETHASAHDDSKP